MFIFYPHHTLAGAKLKHIEKCPHTTVVPITFFSRDKPIAPGLLSTLSPSLKQDDLQMGTPPWP